MRFAVAFFSCVLVQGSAMAGVFSEVPTWSFQEDISSSAVDKQEVLERCQSEMLAAKTRVQDLFYSVIEEHPCVAKSPFVSGSFKFVSNR